MAWPCFRECSYSFYIPVDKPVLLHNVEKSYFHEILFLVPSKTISYLISTIISRVLTSASQTIICLVFFFVGNFFFFVSLTSKDHIS